MSDDSCLWTSKLTRAAMPGAVSVTFSWTKTEDGHSFSLESHDAQGAAIGDDRDYDLLKVHFEALGELAEQEGFGAVGETRSVTLDLNTQVLARSW